MKRRILFVALASCCLVWVLSFAYFRLPKVVHELCKVPITQPEIQNAPPQPTPEANQPEQHYWNTVRRPDILPIWIGGIGAVLASVAAFVTLIFIGTQTNALKRQTAIQTATMAQWVELNDWQSKDLWEGESPTLQVSFYLFNPTNFLLILNHAEIAFSPELPERYFLVTRGTPLPPSKPIHVTICLPVTVERMGTFRTGTLGLSVEGTIDFVSALKEDTVQRVSGILTCSLFESKFASTIKLDVTKKK